MKSVVTKDLTDGSCLADYELAVLSGKAAATKRHHRSLIRLLLPKLLEGTDYIAVAVNEFGAINANTEKNMRVVWTSFGRWLHRCNHLNGAVPDLRKRYGLRVDERTVDKLKAGKWEATVIQKQRILVALILSCGWGVDELRTITLHRLLSSNVDEILRGELESWTAVRDRAKSSPAERRRFGLTIKWASSELAFPTATGMPMSRSALYRCRALLKNDADTVKANC